MSYRNAEVEAYIAGIRSRLIDARDAFEAVVETADGDELGRLASEVREIMGEIRAAELNAYGVACPQCCGGADVVLGWDPATYYKPAEPVSMECDYCKGAGLVLPDERAEWLATHGEPA